MIADPRPAPTRLQRRQARPLSSLLPKRVPAERQEVATTEWRIQNDVLVDPLGKRYPVLRHGLTKWSAAELSHQGATVLYGHYPQLTDITSDLDQVRERLASVRPSGEIFTVFASSYRRAKSTVLLLDYLT